MFPTCHNNRAFPPTTGELRLSNNPDSLQGVMPAPYDSFAIFATGVQVGYVAKSENRKWGKRVREAFDRNELVCGMAHAVSAKGTNNTGIFGYIWWGK